MSASLFENLKTYEGFVSTNADEYSALKTDLCKAANLTFNGKQARKYWKTFDDANVVVFQLDGTYFVIDTDDEESDDFVCDIMAKYGVMDNVTPSLSNHLLGKKNKNHYWFRLPAEMKWTCQTHYTKYGQQKEYSHLDLLGSKNRIMFENKESLDNLKNVPMLTLEILNDLKDFVPVAMQNMPAVTFKQPITPKPVIEKDTTLIENDDECPEDIKDFVDANLNAELSNENETFFYNSCYLLRRYGDEKNGNGWKAVHYFAKMAGKKVYNKEKVNTWLAGTKIENMKPTYATKIKGKCLIALDDGDESDWSQASTTTENVIVYKKEKKDYSGMIIKQHEDRNFTTITEKITPYIKTELKYCREEWYSYDCNTHLWNVVKEPQKMIKKYMFLCIGENNTHIALKLANEQDKIKRDTLVAVQKEYLNLYSKVESLQNITLVKRDLMILLCDNEFSNKLDLTSGKIVFQDGIYDITTDTFREGLKYEDYLTYTLPYKFRRSVQENKEYVKREVMKICGNEEWRYNYYMEILGYSMLGMPEKEQVAFFMVGLSAGNGKSTLLEALTKMMPNLVVNLNSKTFSKGNSNFHKNINSIKRARIAWINEVEKVKQDIDLIKMIADGTAIKNPVLFQQQEELIKIIAKLFFVSNGEISFASDEGIKRRYRYVEFVSKFHKRHEYDALEEKRDIDFVEDKTFSEYLITEDGFFALLDLVLEGARRFIINKGLNVPAKFIELAKRACEKNEEFAEFVSNNIKKSVGKKISRYEIEERYKMVYQGKNLVNEKGEFRTYMATKGFIYNCKEEKKICKVTRSGCYMDCELIDLVEE